VVIEFATPTAHSWPFGIAAGSDGNVWFTASYPGLGWITPSGIITELSLSDVWFLTAGADGDLWAAGIGTLKRISPDGSTSTFSIPAPTLEWGNPPRTRHRFGSGRLDLDREPPEPPNRSVLSELDGLCGECDGPLPEQRPISDGRMADPRWLEWPGTRRCAHLGLRLLLVLRSLECRDGGQGPERLRVELP
jgi:hypothetical protein